MATALHPSEFFQMKLHMPEGRMRIAYFDTESSKYDHFRTLERVKYFSCWNNLPEWFDSFTLRQDGHRQIQLFIDAYLKNNPDCSVLIVDGLLDLISNYNNEDECKELINFMKRITYEYNILLIAVLHLGKKDKETLGHLGSATDRYAQSTLLIEKDKNTQSYNLSSRFMRSDIDFEPVSIQNFNGYWNEIPYVPEPFPVNKQTKKSK